MLIMFSAYASTIQAQPTNTDYQSAPSKTGNPNWQTPNWQTPGRPAYQPGYRPEYKSENNNPQTFNSRPPPPGQARNYNTNQAPSQSAPAFTNRPPPTPYNNQAPYTRHPNTGDYTPNTYRPNSGYIPPPGGPYPNPANGRPDNGASAFNTPGYYPQHNNNGWNNNRWNNSGWNNNRWNNNGRNNSWNNNKFWGRSGPVPG